MKIRFKEKEPQKILEQMQSLLAGRKLGDIVDFTLQGKDLDVTIKKMGTSSLHFAHSALPDGMQWELTQEKIAFAHKAFKNEMVDKITHLVQQAGGEVQA